MSRLLAYKDKSLIKVITGMRRSGKSVLLELFKRHLRENGVSDERIVHMNFESLRYAEIKDYMDLYKYIMDKIDPNSRTYILLDEIQQVTDWEKCVNSLRVDCDADIYITGSNAYLLSSELSTLLSGRYVTIKMLPLSFKEFLDFNEASVADGAKTSTGLITEKFDEYLKYGAMPLISELDKSEPTITAVLTDVYDTVILKDVIYRNAVKDTALLENVVRFVIDNIGSIISPKRISDFLNSEGKKTTSETIDNYLKMLESAFIVYRAKRFDLKGKQYLKTLNKYYVVDTGIRNALLGFRDVDYGHILENIVYFELLRRNDDVCIGKYNGYEVDFVAESPDDKKYYQVAATILDETTAQREFRPLEAIKDNYEKTVLTMDRNFIKSKNGIKVMNIIDFLLQ
jgi:predicted AAA+ superfamily ATPase